MIPLPTLKRKGQFGSNDCYASPSSLIILEVQETIDRVVANVPHGNMCDLCMVNILLEISRN